MDQVLSLQHLEVLETGYEISKILTHAGYRMDQAVFTISWGKLVEAVATGLSEQGLSVNRFSERFILDLLTSLQNALVREEILEWPELVSQYVIAQPEIADLLEADCEPFDNDDDGPLTEQYENASRCLDDEAYWPDGGLSAGFSEE